MLLFCYQEAEAVVCKMFVRLTGAAGRMEPDVPRCSGDCLLEPDVPETICWSQFYCTGDSKYVSKLSRQLSDDSKLSPQLPGSVSAAVRTSV